MELALSMLPALPVPATLAALAGRRCHWLDQQPARPVPMVPVKALLVVLQLELPVLVYLVVCLVVVLFGLVP